jgi:hypothetical protein
MAQVCSVTGEGLGLLPNRALSASVRRPSANDDRFKMRIAGPLRSVFTLREMYDIILYILDKGGNHV